MFTGIDTDLGRVRAIEKRGDVRFEIETAYDTAGIEIGASIACDGVCLTVIETGADWFAVAASAETLSRSALGDWRTGAPINLERPLGVGAELGGHIVLGHVDGLARIVGISPEGDSLRFLLEVDEELARYIAPKGSVALDGVSLTVNEVEDLARGGARFGVNIIEHTREHTTFGTAKEGEQVNLEVDLLARYTARLLERS